MMTNPSHDPPGVVDPDGATLDDGRLDLAAEPSSPTTRDDIPLSTATRVTPTRVSASWTAVVAAVVLLIILVIFIAENTQRSTVNFVGFHGHAPTAVVLLIAAITGSMIVIIVGAARILQLRKVARRSEARTHEGGATTG